MDHMDISLKTGEIVSVLKKKSNNSPLTPRLPISVRLYRLVMESPEFMACNRSYQENAGN
jgi:hypothetical protein